MSQQLTVALQPPQEETDLSGSEEGRETQLFFYEYMARRVTTDSEVRESDARIIQRERETIRGGSEAAVQVASRLADLGDEIDFHYKQEMDEIVALTETPETAFSLFYDVVKNLFEWDQQGGAKINLGRVAALMAYCYSLCKTFITKRVGGGGMILSFVGLIAGWLFKFLIQAKFYEWLRSIGGWGQLISTAAEGIPWGRNVFLVFGLASIAVWAFSYFRSS